MCSPASWYSPVLLQPVPQLIRLLRIFRVLCHGRRAAAVAQHHAHVGEVRLPAPGSCSGPPKPQRCSLSLFQATVSKADFMCFRCIELLKAQNRSMRIFSWADIPSSYRGEANTSISLPKSFCGWIPHHLFGRRDPHTRNEHTQCRDGYSRGPHR